MVSKDGGIWSIISNRWLKTNTKSNSGHFRTGLCRNGKCYTRLVHQLVLETFVGLCPDGMEARHLDGNPQNNRLNNLRWGTHKQNMLDAVKHGTAFCLRNKGEKHSCSKLTEENVKTIIRDYRTGLFTYAEIANKYGVRRQTIGKIVTGKRWKHVKDRESNDRTKPAKKTRHSQ